MITRRLLQQGQTLIETIVGLFVLTMGISAAVGLAIYAFGASTSITKQIVGAGLAREGIEAVKNMRDTNWMLAGPIDNDCYNFASTTANNAFCFKNWMKPASYNNGNGANNDVPFNIDPGGGSNGSDDFFLGDTNVNATKRYWNFTNGSTYGLNFSSVDANNSGFAGYYVANNTGTSNYYRQITITKDSTSPYNTSSLGPLLKIRSRVWWKDKKCLNVNSASAWSLIPNICKIELNTYLTNWKDYK